MRTQEHANMGEQELSSRKLSKSNKPSDMRARARAHESLMARNLVSQINM